MQKSGRLDGFVNEHLIKLESEFCKTALIYRQPHLLYRRGLSFTQPSLSQRLRHILLSTSTYVKSFANRKQKIKQKNPHKNHVFSDIHLPLPA